MSAFTGSGSVFQRTVLVPHRRDCCYDQLKLPSETTNLGVTASSKFVAYHESSGSNSAVGVFPLSSVGKHHIPLRAPAYQQPLIRGHSQVVNDIAFEPFRPEVLYSCSTDATVKVWEIPSDGLLADLSIPRLVLQTPGKSPMRGLAPNRSSRGVVAARSSREIYIFDVVKGSLMVSSSASSFAADMYSISWSYMGDLLLATAKDKTMKLLDLRLSTTSHSVSTVATHTNNRPSTAVWLGDSPYIATLGHSAAIEREIMVWDSRRLDSYVQLETLDKTTGQNLGFFDADSSLLVTTGKGDSSVRLYEFHAGAAETKHLQLVSESSVDGVAKGATVLPKQACDLMECEVLRLLRLCEDSIQPVSVQVPRDDKQVFHEELYPPSVSEAPPSMDADMWAAGLLVAPMKVIIRPGESTTSAPKLADAIAVDIPVHVAGNDEVVVPSATTATTTAAADSSTVSPSSSIDTQTAALVERQAVHTSPSPQKSAASVPPVPAPMLRSSSSASTSSEKGSGSQKALNFGSTQKYRHLHGAQSPKERTFFNLRPQAASSEGPVIACSDLFWAIPYQGSGGGPVYVSRHDNFGKVEPVCPTINGHKSAVTDINFSPFHSGMFATASQDAKIKIWSLSEDSDFVLPSMTDEDAVATLATHGNTVKTCNFHPTVDGLLCSSSTDGTVRFFDVHASSEVSCLRLESAGIGGAVSNISFNFDGSLIVLACKDKSIRIVDPRTNTLVLSTETVSSPRSSSSSSSSSSSPRSEAALALGRNLRAEWCSSSSGSSGTILSVCSASNGCRMIHSWDPRLMNIPLCGKNIDSGAGQLYPLYDEGTGVCLLAGKGDRIIRFFELSFLREVEVGAGGDGKEKDGATFEKCSEFQAVGDPIAGICVLPKSSCDVRKVEVARVLKLTGDSVQPISFTVPRAENLKKYFQDDIFPPTRSKTPSATAAQWANGSADTLAPLMHSLRPDDMINVSEKPEETSSKSKIGQFRADIDKSASESRQREDAFSRLQRMANQHAAYHPNLSMGTAAAASVTIVGKRVDAAPVYDEDSDDGGWDE